MSGSAASAAGLPTRSPQLRRVLSRTDLVVYGLTVITPTAVFPVFGILQEISNGHVALSYLVAVVAMLLTAFSYARMAAAFPSAGSTYTYAKESLHEHVGFLAGWAMILDYVLVQLLSAVYVALTAVRLAPSVPYFVWAFAFAAGISVVNLYGIRVTAHASKMMMLIMSAVTVLFVVLAAHHAMSDGGPAAIVVPEVLFNRETFAVQPLLSAAAVATLSYLGFDAISTLAEDTRHPEADIGFATVLVCLLQTAFCFLVSYLAALVWFPRQTFPHTETAILDVSRVIGGTGMLSLTTFVLLVGAVASSVACQAGASRLLYGMGRDGILPRSIFGYLDPERATPTRSILLMGGISFVGALLISFQTVVELVNFGAFAGFILVNLSVVSHYFFRRRERSGIALYRNLILPVAGAAVCAFVWKNLGANAKLMGFTWLALGLVYLAAMTRGFRRRAQQWEMP